MSLGGRAFISAMGLLPKHAISRLAGQASRLPSRGAVRAFARRYGANLDEAELPIESYASLAEFFTRRLRPGARPIDADPDVLVAPADGVLDQAGPIAGGELLQAKGRGYTLAALLGSGARAERYAGGSFATIYLSPKDYHRVHAPVGARVEGATSIPGRLYPVNPHAVEWVDGLFATNERVVTHLGSPTFGPVEVVMVGATVVGSVRLAFDAGLGTNRGLPAPSTHLYEDVRLEKGAELGLFEMGSTVVLVFGPGVELLPRPIGSVVKVGEALARRRRS